MDMIKMDREKLRNLAEEDIEGFFETIEFFVDARVAKIVEKEHIENDDDINYLKKKIMRGILKLE